MKLISALLTLSLFSTSAFASSLSLVGWAKVEVQAISENRYQLEVNGGTKAPGCPDEFVPPTVFTAEWNVEPAPQTLPTSYVVEIHYFTVMGPAGVIKGWTIAEASQDTDLTTFIEQRMQNQKP